MSFSYFKIVKGEVDTTDSIPITEIDKAIKDLETIKAEQSGAVYNVDFRADPNFVPVSEETWRTDAARQWFNLNSVELVQRYQKHFESYCYHCKKRNIVPTKDGFRVYLMMVNSAKK